MTSARGIFVHQSAVRFHEAVQRACGALQLRAKRGGRHVQCLCSTRRRQAGLLIEQIRGTGIAIECHQHSLRALDGDLQ